MSTLRLRALAALLLLLLSACGGAAPRPLSLTIAHVNDTHSALEPADETLVVAGQTLRAKLGGVARLKTALDEVRAREKNVLTLHAGDAVQGTLYFNLFNGEPEFEFLNLLGFDAMAVGNHEFDRGPALLGRLAGQARFPLLSANIDASGEAALAGRIRPYTLRSVEGQLVALLGSTTPATPLMTSGVGQARFAEPGPVLAALVRELKALGVNKIILLSHNGYEADLELARTVPGLDVIVGGHSHTLLGDAAGLARLGLRPAGPYPTVVQGPEGAPVLVAQAWKWGEVLGVLTVHFDAEGRVAGHSAAPVLLAGEEFRVAGRPVDPASPDFAQFHAQVLEALRDSGMARSVAPDPDMLRRLEPYARQVAQVQNAPLGARATVDLLRGSANDPGPLVADAYLAKSPGAQVALVGAGGLRRDLFAGELSLGMVMGLLPFGNTLVRLELSGAELKAALEEAVEFRLSARPPRGGDLRTLPVIHTAGLSYVIRPAEPKGQRIQKVLLRRADGGQAPLDLAATYSVVTNSFLAGGGDGLAPLKNASGPRLDTGYLEHDVLAEHLTALGVVEPVPLRVVIELPGQGVERPALRLPKGRRSGEKLGDSFGDRPGDRSGLEFPQSARPLWPGLGLPPALGAAA